MRDVPKAMGALRGVPPWRRATVNINAFPWTSITVNFANHQATSKGNAALCNSVLASAEAVLAHDHVERASACTGRVGASSRAFKSKEL